MSEIEKIKGNVERGYTMAIYGTTENLHNKMREDIETLLHRISILTKSNKIESKCKDCGDFGVLDDNSTCPCHF